MVDGFYAFLFLAIFVWFVLGMIIPSISLPPIILNFLEPGAMKPSRKIVIQWSCIFTVLLFVVLLITDVFTTSEVNISVNSSTHVSSADANTIARKIKNSDIVDTKIEVMNTVEAIDMAIDSGKSGCLTVAEISYPNMKLIAHQVLTVEQVFNTNPTDSGIAPALADIRSRLKEVRNEIDKAGCRE